jgi:PilX N-terminal
MTTRRKKIAGGEAGSALIISLILLVILTLIGIYAISISTTEFEMATYNKTGKIALNAAEAGAYYAIDYLPGLVVPPVNLANGSWYTASWSDSNMPPDIIVGYGTNYRYVYFNVNSEGHAPAPHVTNRRIFAEVGFGPVPYGTMY